MMSVLVYADPLFADHDTGPGHPECAARYGAVMAALDAPEFAALPRRTAPDVTAEAVARAHPGGYLEALLDRVPDQGLANIYPDTVLSPKSGAAALRAAGVVVDAVDRVLDGTARAAFCAVRPPGHHAESARAMGFCLINNVAVAALHALAERGLDRVAVVDFDVHHGNGTQEIFWDRPNAFYASTHQYPNYPGTGRAAETGAHDNIVNAPLPPGAGGAQFRAAMRDRVLPALEAFAPELTLISAGFDAHEDDPLAALHFTEDDFAWATTALMDVADSVCAGRIVSALEGGYDLPALGRSVAAHVRALQG